MTTPPGHLPGYDTLPWPDDALAVWIEADDQARDAVRRAMPELAAALDRQAEYMKTPPDQRRPQIRRYTGQRPVPWQERDKGSGS